MVVVNSSCQNSVEISCIGSKLLYFEEWLSLGIPQKEASHERPEFLQLLFRYCFNEIIWCKGCFKQNGGKTLILHAWSETKLPLSTLKFGRTSKIGNLRFSKWACESYSHGVLASTNFCQLMKKTLFLNYLFPTPNTVGHKLIANPSAHLEIWF